VPDQPVLVASGPDLEVWVLPCGRISAHPAHVEFRGPAALALPAILAGRRWVPRMPINAVLVRHRTGAVLVDTGERADPPADWYACGAPGNAWFYRNHLRIEVAPHETVDARPRGIGVDPAEVDDVVLTHLHGDHLGGLPALRPRRVLLGNGARSARGALPCRLRDHRPVEVGDGEDRIGDLDGATVLDEDGRVGVLPLPGHTPGHIGLAVHTGPGDADLLVAAGDAAFGQDQIARRGTPGIAADPAANRRTQARLAAVSAGGGRVVLSHEAVAPQDGDRGRVA
jgi:N-acyl homoserine lactone hydrolase